MAGRGRGKPTMSFNTEQLGVSKGELPAQVLQPPLPYPILDLHISNFESTNEIDYLVELKRDFAEYMRDSANNVSLDVLKKDIERYSDHYQDTIVGNSEQEPKHDWSRMPAELAPSLKRKVTSQKTGQEKKIKVQPKRNRRRIVDDEEDADNSTQNTEAKAEQPKNTKQAAGGNLDKDIKEEQEEDEEKSEEEMEEYEEVDEEMDDGTDYVNNYFDNGEGFDDEDDNLDDGATY